MNELTYIKDYKNSKVKSDSLVTPILEGLIFGCVIVVGAMIFFVWKV